ncbi:MAG: acyl-CoA dehydrogenase family protein, partial [Parvibaculales bacterium]
DLASLRTAAVVDGDDFVINGQKIWTSTAQFADMMFCLVRTEPDAPKHQGISYILIDMNTPGIEVKPIITIDGGHEVNEVFLTDVRVPAKNLVGEQDKGWTIAKFLLGNERSGIAGVARSKKAIDRLRDIARAELEDGAPLLDSADFSKKIAELEVDLTALEYTELRTLASESKGQGPGPESSILKIKGTEIQQRITELTMEAVGNYASPWVPQLDRGDNYLAIGPDHAEGVSQSYFNNRK